MWNLKKRRERKRRNEQRQIECMLAALDNNYQRQVRNTLAEGKKYIIEKMYADAPAGVMNFSSGTGDIGLAEVVLKIYLDASDWYKFQSQPFYQELIQYLDNLQIR